MKEVRRLCKSHTRPRKDRLPPSNKIGGKRDGEFGTPVPKKPVKPLLIELSRQIALIKTLSPEAISIQVHSALVWCSEVVLLDVVLEVGKVSGGLAVVENAAGRAALGGAGLAGVVVLGLANPLTELEARLDLDEGNLGLLGETGDELDVLGIIAVGGEDAEVGVLSIEGLADLVEALNDTYK